MLNSLIIQQRYFRTKTVSPMQALILCKSRAGFTSAVVFFVWGVGGYTAVTTFVAEDKRISADSLFKGTTPHQRRVVCMHGLLWCVDHAMKSD